jgi:hypothetical protein
MSSGAPVPAPELVSVSSTSQLGNADSGVARTSADGRFVAFRSEASNLVAGDTNGGADIFVRDRERRTTIRVSVDSSGGEANGTSFMGAISADGRFVAFGSHATNLVPDDRDFESDVFVHDLVTGATELASVNSAEEQQNGTSAGMDISADGRYVAFASAASNLVPGDTNNQTDAFVRDRQAGETERASVSSVGVEGNGPVGQSVTSVAIDGAGRFVALESFASNLVPGDTNDAFDVFIRDRATRTTERVETGGAFLDEISDDGQHVLFDAFASNQPDVFVRDRATGQTERVSVNSVGEPANGTIFGGPISADGQVVGLSSEASNLVPGDTNGLFDAFARDRRTSTTRRLSVSGTGAEGNGHSSASALSADGTLVIFESGASNLVPGDTNGAFDVFASRVLALPGRKEDCKHGGWRRFGFKNQGECIGFVHGHSGPGPPG